MFEVRLQTYWADADAAGIVYFPNFFKFAGNAEEEMFRAAGKDLRALLGDHHLLLPRVEAFSRFAKPIRLGTAIRVQLKPQLQGEKTIRYDFEILSDATAEKLAAGYITVVCVDEATFKSAPIPDAIRNIVAQHA
jgi:YbgC/YbaW family acyl-CoA thioester hydrolase